jgi:hypothetical protein
MLRKRERREFLRKIALGTIGISWMPQLIASPYTRVLNNFEPTSPVRISGAVKEGGKALNGVTISDGLNVVSTMADGTFDLISSSERPFVWMSMPSGYNIPSGNKGAANFYKSIDYQNGSMEVQWDLEKLKINDDKHAFLVMADPQTQDMDDIGILKPRIWTILAGSKRRQFQMQNQLYQIQRFPSLTSRVAT